MADPKLGYFATVAPLVVKDHILAGVSGDVTDIPGFLDSRDPETGKLQWRWFSQPKPGEPGSETWPKGTDAITHGGGMTWVTGTYDPELNLIYWGTGNPNPVISGSSRIGDDLYTCSIVALNPDTGKLKWAFQPSPHDTHDWDAAQTPVLFDDTNNGAHRKLLAQAAVTDTSSSSTGLPAKTSSPSLSSSRTGRPASTFAVATQKREGRDARWRVGFAEFKWRDELMAPSYDPETGLSICTHAAPGVCST